MKKEGEKSSCARAETPSIGAHSTAVIASSKLVDDFGDLSLNVVYLSYRDKIYGRNFENLNKI